MRWFLIFFAVSFAAPFAIQLIKSWGGDEATIPIQIFGDTYERDENPTMYTVAISLNYVVVFAAIAFVGYKVFQIVV